MALISIQSSYYKRWSNISPNNAGITKNSTDLVQTEILARLFTYRSSIICQILILNDLHLRKDCVNVKAGNVIAVLFGLNSGPICLVSGKFDRIIVEG